MKTRLLAILATLALLLTCAAFSVSAESTVEAVQPNAAPAAYDGTTGCPHCGQTNITWTPMQNQDYAASSDLHLVVEAGTTLNVTSRMDLNCSSADAEIVIWVKGTITFADGITLFIGNNYASSATNHTEVWFVGGGGSIGGKGYDNANNGNLRVFRQATLYITNALNIGFEDPANNAVRAGVLDINAGTVYMQGGTINGYNTTNSSTKGGAVFLRDSTTTDTYYSSFIMTGGTINGGNVPKGGAIYTTAANTTITIGGNANVYGGSVSSTGSAIYCAAATNQVTIEGNAKIFGNTAGTHGGAIYLYGKSDLTIQGDARVCGGTATSNGGAIYIGNSGTLDITGNAQIIGGTAALGGCVYSTTTGAIEISGQAQVTGGSADDGGTIYTAKTLNITGGTINGGTATNGGAIYLASGTMDIKGGTVNGGTATNGGAIYVAGGTLTMQSGTDNATGTVNGSVAEKGGAIYLDEEASFTMTAGTVNGCNITDATTTTVNGGAIYSVATGETAVQLNGGTVDGGTIARAANSSQGITKLEGRGSAIYMNGGVLNIGGADIVGGKAQEGGCVYVNAGTLNMTDGTMSGGDGLGNGGTVFLKSTMNMSGGTLTANTKNTYAYSRGIRVVNGTLNLSGTAHVIGAGGSEGNAIYVLTTSSSKTAMVTLADQAKVSNPSGSWNYNIFMSYYGKLATKVEVKAGWTGSASVKFGYIYGSTMEEGAAYTVGMQFPAKYAAATGDFDGKLHMEVAANRPTIHWDGATGLKASDVQIVTADGISWYKNNASAVEAYTDGYIKLYNENALDLGAKDVYVDFNGKCVDVTGSGKLYGFDTSASATGAGTAAANVPGVTVEFVAVDPVGGDSYVAITENDVATFHVIKPVVDGVSLRPGSAGMYYSGKVICDDTLASYVTAYGIALSLKEMPGQDFKSKSLYTQETKALTPGGSFNGVLVDKVMKPGAENNARAEGVVHANAYVTIQIGDKTLTCLSSDSGSAASMSLKTLVGKVNAVYRTLNANQQSALNILYNNFKTDMTDSSWHINNIAAGAGDDMVANDQDGLKVLMIGNSLSVDAGRMLAYVFAQEGYDNVRISTLYRSGCKLYQHVDHIEDPTNADYLYTFYNSQYTNAADAVANPASVKPTTTSKKTMLYGIQQEDWDVIVMQQGSSQAAQADTYNEDIQTIIDYVLENDIDKTTKPAFVWNSIWGYPYNAVELESDPDNQDYSDYVTLLKNNTGSDTADAAAQIKMVDLITQAAKDKILTNDQFAYVIPTGTAFIHGCAALSNKVMYYDYIHASDLGRLMVSYMWYSAITGNAVEDLPNTIPGVLRRVETTDRAVTAAEETVLLECISKAFAQPYTMPTGFAN